MHTNPQASPLQADLLAAPRPDANGARSMPHLPSPAFPEPSSGSDSVTLWHGLDGLLPPPPMPDWHAPPPLPLVSLSLAPIPHDLRPPEPLHSQGPELASQGLTQDGTPPDQQLPTSRLACRGDIASMLPIPRPIIPPPPNAPEIEGGITPEFWSTPHDDIDDGFRYEGDDDVLLCTMTIHKQLAKVWLQIRGEQQLQARLLPLYHCGL